MFPEFPVHPTPLDFWQWFAENKIGVTVAAGALLAVLFVIAFLKAVVKTVKIIALLAIAGLLLVYGGNLVSDWEAHKARLKQYMESLRENDIPAWLEKGAEKIKEQIL